MSESLVNLSIILLCAFSHAFFQLDAGGLLLLYHSSLGKHVPKKTRILASNFLLGVAFFLTLCLSASSFILLIFFSGELSISTLSLLVGILVAVSLIIFTIYYRTGRSTELWLPKAVTRFISQRAKETSSRVEAFSLGMMTSFAEIPFSLVLLVLASNSLLSLSLKSQLIAIFLYIFIAILPLLSIRVCVRQGKTIADIQRWRLKNKTFLRILGGIGFIVLALFIFAFKIYGELF
ncbi:hypothetical protein IKG45_03130 [Candidatus Saccharibacteria bacterium]|nr:hypothetical protein [Candidatus Saccharibacteria bacterium]